jgi:hypothetical protein
MYSPDARWIVYTSDETGAVIARVSGLRSG